MVVQNGGERLRSVAHIEEDGSFWCTVSSKRA